MLSLGADMLHCYMDARCADQCISVINAVNYAKKVAPVVVKNIDLRREIKFLPCIKS